MNSDVDALLSDFYRQIDGANTLGVPISPLFTYGSISYQYTPGGLIGYNPEADRREQYFLAPIGLEMGILESAIPPPDDPALRYVDGHVIDPAFLSLYEKMGGGRVTGRPLTEARYNPAEKRVEQFFENVGFYYREDDPSQTAGLLPFGAWACAEYCRISGANQPGTPVQVGAVFHSAVNRLGLQFTGFPLTAPYLAADGSTEQIFENVILCSPASQEGRVILRPAPAWLGIQPHPLAPPSSDPEQFFFPISDGNGYNVPKVFLDYLALHGGLDAAGPPISDVIDVDGAVRTQCFANLCLEERRAEKGMLRVRPSPLGFEFLATYPTATLSGFAAPGMPEAYPMPDQASLALQDNGEIVHVWKKYPILTSDQRQEIGVIVLEDNLPVPDILVDLLVQLPEGESLRFAMQPTGSDGQSMILLDPIQAVPGKPVQYEVCVYYRAGDATCVQDSFLIWE